MKKVFLSHSSTDKAFVKKIKKILYPFGTHSWLDEQEIFPGDKLWDTILKGIDSSDRAIIFVTKNSQNSEWVTKEVKEFLLKEEIEQQTKIIPIIFTPNPPSFLTERLYIDFHSRPFANCIKDLLTGIYRNRSVMVIEPLKENPYELESFKEELAVHKKYAENGELIFVYNYYSLLDIILESITSDEYHFSESKKVMFPKMFEFLIAVTPRLLMTIFNYYKNEPSVYFVAEKTIKYIWRSLIMVIISSLNKFGDKKILLKSQYNINNCFLELERIQALRNENKPYSYSGISKVMWLEYLNSDWKDTYDIGFRGRITIEGEQIFDAGHVRIKAEDIESFSLSNSRPEFEFSNFVWVNNILPYIAFDAIIRATEADLEIFEAVQRIGLKKNDFFYFGIE